MANATMAITIKARDLATKGIKSAGSAVKGMTRSLFSLKGAMAALAGGFGAFKFSQEFLEANSTLEQMRFRMDALLGSAERGEKAFEFIRKFQRENPIGSIQEMTSAFEGLVVAGIDPASGALEALITGSRKFGLTEDAVKGVTVALRQMSAKGNLQAEELNQLAERLPGIYKKLANELGFGDNVKKFQDDMKKRLIGGQEASLAVIRVLAKEGEGVAEEYANTWQAKITQLKSLWFDIMTDIGKVGAFDKVKKTLDGIIKLVQKNKGLIVAYFDTLGNKFLDSINLAIDFLNKQDFVDNAKKVFKIFNELFGLVKKVGIGIAIATVEAVNMFLKIENKVIETRRMLYNLGIIDPFGDEQKKIEDLKKEYNSLAKLRDIAEKKSRDTNLSKETRNANRAAFNNLNTDASQASRELQAMQEKLHEMRKLYRAENLTNRDTSFLSTDSLWESLGEVNDITDKYNEKIDKLIPAVIEKMKKGAVAVKKAASEVVDAGTNGINLSDYKATSAKKTSSQLFVEGWNEALEKAKEKYDWFMSDFAQTGKFMAETVTGALSRQFDDFFTDLIDGKIKSFKDAILGFLKDIARAMSQAFSQKLSAQIVKGLGTAVSGYFATPVTESTFAGTQGTPSLPGPNQSTMLSKASAQKVEIINNTNEPVQASKATVRQDVSGQIMSIVIDSVRTNKGGSRQALKASLM